jgi:hypothetical protein
MYQPDCAALYVEVIQVFKKTCNMTIKTNSLRFYVVFFYSVSKTHNHQYLLNYFYIIIKFK